jgi:hypothetical protein
MRKNKSAVVAVTQAAVQEKPDPNAADARKALARIGTLTAQIDRALNQIPLCREAWCEYGNALRAGRTQRASNKAFGDWVKANKLDTGLASSPVVRSDAMWLAENWDAVLSTLKTTHNHRPDHLRQEYRRAVRAEREGFFINADLPIDDLRLPPGHDAKDWAYARQTTKLLSRIAHHIKHCDPERVARGLLRDELPAISEPTIEVYEFVAQLRTLINNVRFGIPSTAGVGNAATFVAEQEAA